MGWKKNAILPPDSSVYMLSHQGMALFEKDKEVWPWSGRGLARGSVSLWVGFEVLACPTVDTFLPAACESGCSTLGCLSSTVSAFIPCPLHSDNLWNCKQAPGKCFLL